MMIRLQHNGRPVVQHVGLWRTPTTAAAGLLMILLQHSGCPVVKHAGLSGLQNSSVCCLHDDFQAGHGWGVRSVTLLYEVGNVAGYQVPGIS